jgi:translation elongation factor EF-1alpha
MMTRGELPFRLEVEQAQPASLVEGAVIIGRFVQGSIHVGDHLELVEPDARGNEQRTRLTCATYSLLCEVDWNPSKDVLLGVTVQGIKPEQVMAGSILQKHEDPPLMASG